MQIGLTEAKAKLSALIAAAERGEEVTITRWGRPVARLVAIRGSRPALRVGIGDDVRFRSRRESRPEFQGRCAIIRRGPPEPPSIFMGMAMIILPVAGNALMSATFSKAAILFVISST